MQTIFAQATARGKAGVAVLRVSGPGSVEVARRLVGDLPEPGRVALRTLRASEGFVIDRGLCVWFRGPASFTGEDVVEFQLHGSQAILKSVEREILLTGLARPAEAGEFTRRALMNERLDLAQVEGLGDLIEAETEAQRRQAYAVFSGAIRAQSDRWRSMLLRAASLLEASIDFADEDVPVDVVPEVTGILDVVLLDVRKDAEGSRVAERVREGFEVAILGAPNAGKSTLLNAIAGREIALTSEIAGTTRDVIEVRMDLHGLPVTMLDTAGLRDSVDVVERMGMDRALQRAEAADLRVVLLTEDWRVPAVLEQRIDIEVGAKSDITGRGGISGRTGEGVDDLLSRIHGLLAQRMATIQTTTSTRHRAALELASQDLSVARDLLDSGGQVELIAEHVRAALRALDSLIGRVDVEDVLGEIFSRFCIGK